MKRVKKTILFLLTLCGALPLLCQTPLAPPFPQGTSYVKGMYVSQTGFGIVGCSNLDVAFADGSGCFPFASIGGSPGGANLDVQYNHPLGTFAGSNAFTFDGSHSAIGVGSIIDNAPIISANDDGLTLSPSVVSLISEDSAQVENGLYLGLTINPSAPTTVAAYGERIDISTSSTGTQWGSTPGFAALVSNAINTGTGTGADAIFEMLNELTSINTNGGEVEEETGAYTASFNVGSGEIDLGLGLNGSVVQDGNGTIDSADEVRASFESQGNGSTTTLLNGVHITTPGNNGDEIDTLNGLLIDEQCVDGVVICNEMQIAGTGNSAFAGPITTPTLSPGTNTTQVATTAFVHAAVAASIGGSTSTLGSCGTGTPTLNGNSRGFKITGIASGTSACTVTFSPSLSVGGCTIGSNSPGVLGAYVETTSVSSVLFGGNSGAPTFTEIDAQCF